MSLIKIWWTNFEKAHKWMSPNRWTERKYLCQTEKITILPQQCQANKGPHKTQFKYSWCGSMSYRIIEWTHSFSHHDWLSWGCICVTLRSSENQIIVYFIQISKTPEVIKSTYILHWMNVWRWIANHVYTVYRKLYMAV